MTIKDKDKVFFFGCMLYVIFAALGVMVHYIYEPFSIRDYLACIACFFGGFVVRNLLDMRDKK